MKKINLYITTHNPNNPLLQFNMWLLRKLPKNFTIFIVSSYPENVPNVLYSDDDEIIRTANFSQALQELNEVTAKQYSLHKDTLILHSLFQEIKINRAIEHTRESDSKYNICIHEDFFILEQPEVLLTNIVNNLDKAPLLVYRSVCKEVNSFVCAFTSSIDNSVLTFDVEHIKKLIWFEYSDIRSLSFSVKPSEYSYDTLGLLLETNDYINIASSIDNSDSVHLGGATYFGNNNDEEWLAMEVDHFKSLGLKIAWDVNTFRLFGFKYKQSGVYSEKIEELLKYVKQLHET